MTDLDALLKSKQPKAILHYTFWVFSTSHQSGHGYHTYSMHVYSLNTSEKINSKSHTSHKSMDMNQSPIALEVTMGSLSIKKNDTEHL